MQRKQEGSGLWKHGLLLTMLFGFTVMLVGGAYIYKTRAPIPENVVTEGWTRSVYGRRHSKRSGAFPQAQSDELRLGAGPRRLPGAGLHGRNAALDDRGDAGRSQPRTVRVA